MSQKQTNAPLGVFSMASITDVIFLLLIFFMVVSTLVVPNAIRVNLPSSRSAAPSDQPVARITLTREGELFFSHDGSEPAPVTPEQLTEELQRLAPADDLPTYAALYADEEVPYKEVVKVLNLTNEQGIKLLLATKAMNDKKKTLSSDVQGK